MIQNPFLPMPTAAAAWSEGFIKGFTSVSSPAPSENVSEDDVEAFNQGVEAGVSSQQSGLQIDNPCIPALEGEHEEVHEGVMVFDGLHFGEILLHGKAARLSMGVASIVVVLVELACTLPKHMLPPEAVLPDLGQVLMNKLASFGLDSIQLFCGAGLDINQRDCEILLSPLFTSQDQARQAAIAMNRPAWVVVSWRTDQTNSFRIPASSDE